VFVCGGVAKRSCLSAAGLVRPGKQNDMPNTSIRVDPFGCECLLTGMVVGVL